MDVSFDGELSAVENARRDESLLRRGVAGGRTAVLQDRSLSLGVAQSPETPAALVAARFGIPVLRRSSGGTGLLHQPGDVVWSLVLPRDDPRVGRDFVASYVRFGAPVAEYLSSVGRPARWSGPFARSDQHCLLGARGEVLVSDGRAIGGAAQHLSAGALLHHGVVDVTVDRDLLRRLFDLDEPTVALLGSLRESGVIDSPRSLAEGVAGALRRF